MSESEYTPLEKCEGLSAEALAVQIRLREDLLVRMVGSLYPPIVRNEIIVLDTLRHKLMYPEKK